MANKWKCLGSLIRKPTKTEKMVARRSARRGGDQRLQWPIFSPEFLPKFRIFLRIIAKISDKILPPKARNHEICDKKERNTLLLWPKWSKRAKNYPKWPQKKLRISDKFCHWNPKNSETQSKFWNSDTTGASGGDKKGGEKVLLWIQQCCDSPTNPYQNWALWGPWVLGGTTQWIIWDQLCLETNVMNLLKLLLAPPVCRGWPWQTSVVHA